MEGLIGAVMKKGVATSLERILPNDSAAPETDHRRLEVRLGRGILYGNNAPKPKPKDTSPPHATAPPVNRIAMEFYARTRASQPSLPINACKRNRGELINIAYQWFPPPNQMLLV